jgi:cephalosporin hydroxylase
VKFATDKWTHGYLPTYLRIAAELGPAARVCEIGVQHGHGLDMFQALFPVGLVAGVDANPGSRWPDGTVKVVASQDDPVLFARLTGYSPEWDLFVDDASHDGNLTVATLRLLWPLLRPGGIYVIEDWMVGLPHIWPEYGDSMLLTAQGLLTLLTRDGDVEDITYRYGLAVLRKKREAP